MCLVGTCAVTGTNDRGRLVLPTTLRLINTLDRFCLYTTLLFFQLPTADSTWARIIQSDDTRWQHSLIQPEITERTTNVAAGANLSLFLCHEDPP
jgi:hypothetical protein